MGCAAKSSNRSLREVDVPGLRWRCGRQILIANGSPKASDVAAANESREALGLPNSRLLPDALEVPLPPLDLRRPREHHGGVTAIEVRATKPKGIRLLLPVALGAIGAVVACTLLIRGHVINFWPIAGAGVALLALGDQVLAFRRPQPASRAIS